MNINADAWAGYDSWLTRPLDDMDREEQAEEAYRRQFDIDDDVEVTWDEVHEWIEEGKAEAAIARAEEARLSPYDREW